MARAAVCALLLLGSRGAEEAPHVLLLGLHRSGSSSLDAFLGALPQLCNGVRKEYHYFDRDHQSRDTYRAYLGNFERCGPGQLVLDSSPSNFRPRALQSMASLFPSLEDKRFLLVLREQAERMLSWFNFKRGRAEYLRTDCPRLQRNCSEHLARGRYERLDSMRAHFEHYGLEADFDYASMVRRVCATVPRRNLLVLSADALFGDTRATLEAVTRFLGVGAANLSLALPHLVSSAEVARRANVPLLPMRCDDYWHFLPHFRRFNQGLVELVNGASDRPPEEPTFAAFGDRFAAQCSGEL